MAVNMAINRLECSEHANIQIMYIELRAVNIVVGMTISHLPFSEQHAVNMERAKKKPLNKNSGQQFYKGRNHTDKKITFSCNWDRRVSTQLRERGPSRVNCFEPRTKGNHSLKDNFHFFLLKIVSAVVLAERQRLKIKNRERQIDRWTKERINKWVRIENKHN